MQAKLNIMKITSFFFFLSFLFCATSQNLPEIEQMVTQEITGKKAVGLAVAVIDSGEIVHLGANGFYDLENKKEAGIHTPFQISSVSKTVTNMAVFKLVESGKIDLEADINNYLPFRVENPFYPDDMITTRELLNHRSGIKDDYQIYEPHWMEPKGDPTIPLEKFLEDYLSVDGALYSDTHFDSTENYQSFAYSNTGVAVLGLIVQHVSGMAYEDFCQKEIFIPLEMTNTSWFLKNLDTSQVAKTYAGNDSTGFVFRGHNGYPDYPGGQLRTSIDDFAKLIAGYLSSSDQFILTEETRSRITPAPAIAHDGFFSWFLRPVADHLYYVHPGGDIGARAIVLMDVSQNNAMILFANSEYDYMDLVKKIESYMWSN